MSDEAIQPKKKGWPKGKPRKQVLTPTWTATDPSAPAVSVPRKASWTIGDIPNWESNEGAESRSDRLHIPAHMHPEGMTLQWITTSVYGQDMSQHRMGYERMGWTPVDPQGGDGRFDGMYMPKGYKGEINVDGLVLMMRPEEMTRKARHLEKMEALERVAIKEQQLRGGDLGIPGADHPSALRTNKISRSLEQITIPKGKEGEKD